jgi:hypothetical protein
MGVSIINIRENNHSIINQIKLVGDQIEKFKTQMQLHSYSF